MPKFELKGAKGAVTLSDDDLGDPPLSNPGNIPYVHGTVEVETPMGRLVLRNQPFYLQIGKAGDRGGDRKHWGKSLKLS